MLTQPTRSSDLASCIRSPKNMLINTKAACAYRLYFKVSTGYGLSIYSFNKLRGDAESAGDIRPGVFCVGFRTRWHRLTPAPVPVATGTGTRVNDATFRRTVYWYRTSIVPTVSGTVRAGGACYDFPTMCSCVCLKCAKQLKAVVAITALLGRGVLLVDKDVRDLRRLTESFLPGLLVSAATYACIDCDPDQRSRL